MQLETPYYQYAFYVLKGSQTAKQSNHQREPGLKFTSCLYMRSAARAVCRAQPCYKGMQLTDKQASVAQPLHRGVLYKEAVR